MSLLLLYPLSSSSPLHDPPGCVSDSVIPDHSLCFWCCWVSGSLFFTSCSTILLMSPVGVWEYHASQFNLIQGLYQLLFLFHLHLLSLLLYQLLLLFYLHLLSLLKPLGYKNSSLEFRMSSPPASLPGGSGPSCGG